MTNIKQWAEKNTWQYRMDNSKGLDGHSNYSGGMDKPDWIVVPGIGRSRDSEILDESNFESALDRLGNESKHVAVVRFGHWGCGWFELLLVNPKSPKHVNMAYKIAEELAQYPVLNESDFSEREYEYQSEYAENSKDSLAEALSKHFGIPVTKGLVNLAYDLTMACQSYHGNDSCINVYSGRSPEKRDVEHLKTCLNELKYTHDKSRVFKTLATKIEAYNA